MNREELINKGADAVRNTPLLFNAYKEFLIQDWGRIPSGCFGCQFNNHFRKWSDQVLNKNIIPMKISNTERTYVLVDKSINRYLNGKVYSNYSTDEDWLEYLEKKPESRSLFHILPAASLKSEAETDLEEDFKKKEPIDLPISQDVVAEKVEIKEVTIEPDKPKRGRKKQS